MIDLKKHLRTVTKKEWCGQDVYLRKIGAKDGLALFSSIKQLATENRKPEDDQIETLKFHANVVAKSLANEQGELLFDTEEGREQLQQVNFHELTELGTMALAHSGYGGETKKNLAPSAAPPTVFASHSDSGPTQTTS